MKLRSVVASVILVFLLAAAGRSAALESRTLTRRNDPIQVPGELLGKFKGVSLDLLRLYVFTQGAMTPIVYQIDERLPNGNFIFMVGEKANPREANRLLDPQDFLVFRVQDAGDRASPIDWPAGAKDALEIELGDPLDQGRAWVYLCRFEAPAPQPLILDTIRLLHWDPWVSPELPFIVESDYFHFEGRVNTVRGKVYKTAINKVFQVPEGAGGTNQNLLDAHKMRAWVELFFGKVRIEANETDMIGGIARLTHGLVRGYGRQWLTIALPLGLKAPRIYSDVITHDRIIISPMRISLPINPETIVTRMGLAFGYDLNRNAYGMRFYSPNCLGGATIDGKMSAQEKAIPTDLAPWSCITGPQGTLLMRAVFDPRMLQQTRSRLTYLDDLNVSLPPEGIPGSIGYVQTSIETESMKAGGYDFFIHWYFPDHFYDPQGFKMDVLQEFLNIEDHPVVIRVEGKQAENAALRPPPLEVSE